MTRLLLDKPTIAKLKQAGDRVELCDDTGNVVGYYYTTAALLDEFELDEPPMTEEEWKRRMSEPRYTTAEVLEHLRKLECSQ